MTRHVTSTRAATEVVSSDVGATAIAPPLLLQGESAADHAILAAKVLGATRPRDFIEELLTRDVIDLTWEIFRFRRLKAGMLRTKVVNEGARVMFALNRDLQITETQFVELCRSDEPAAHENVASALAKVGLTMDDVMALGVYDAIDDLERLDRLLASAEARRNNALREIDRHREALGRAVRHAVEDVQDADFHDLETGEMEGAPPS
jgi:hypothetical protein